jgi:hypothetical protein
MGNNDYKIVEFDKYCDTCKHKEVSEDDEPCFCCLLNPVNLNSIKPVNYEEK